MKILTHCELTSNFSRRTEHCLSFLEFLDFLLARGSSSGSEISECFLFSVPELRPFFEVEGNSSREKEASSMSPSTALSCSRNRIKGTINFTKFLPLFVHISMHEHRITFLLIPFACSSSSSVSELKTISDLAGEFLDKLIICGLFSGATGFKVDAEDETDSSSSLTSLAFSAKNNFLKCFSTN